MRRLVLAFASLAAITGCPITVSVTVGGSDTEVSTTDPTTTGGSTTGGFVCEDPHSMLDGDKCYCVEGFEWCSDDPNDLSCCPAQVTTGPEPTSDSGSTTTSSSSTSTTRGTGTDATGSSSSGGPGSTSGGPVCPGEQAPPDTCDNGSFWCTQPEACGPEGSELYRCADGVWVLEPDLPGDNCAFDGFDFAYGCVDDGDSVVFLCGDGPGTACQGGDPASCVDDTVLAECTFGKLTHFDCLKICTEVGDDMGVLYDFGSCGEDQGAFGCLCCDMGDPGCPI